LNDVNSRLGRITFYDGSLETESVGFINPFELFGRDSNHALRGCLAEHNESKKEKPSHGESNAVCFHG
jgi:hypothetical protein